MEHAAATVGQQQEMPFAIVQGAPLTELPKDLYIPPDALEVFLEAFEGPLDLLLYLIRRQNLDILDIPIAEITAQYMEYVELMRAVNLELAADYLVMAAMLAEIKSRMLLPRSGEASEDEDDPRAELVRRLQEYERYRQAAESIDHLPRLGREIFTAHAHCEGDSVARLAPQVELQELLLAMAEVVRRSEMFQHHHVQREPLSVRERMSQVLARLDGEGFVPFMALFDLNEGRAGVVVTFLALLELTKLGLIELVQNAPFAELFARAGRAQLSGAEAADGVAA